VLGPLRLRAQGKRRAPIRLGRRQLPAGLGDLGLGFTAPHLVLALAPLDAGGASATTIVLHGVDGLVGTAFAAQGFTLQGGEIGLGDTLSLVIAP